MKERILIFVGLVALLVSCMSTKHNNIEMKTERITYFRFEHRNSMAMSGDRYEVSTTPEGRVCIVIDKELPGQKEFYLDDTAIFVQLQEIVKKFKMDEYKGNYQPEITVYDGSSWELFYRYDSGRSVRSGGYEACPENYVEMRRALAACFQQWCEQK